MWFVVISVNVYVENCRYFSVVTVVRLLNGVVCGYQCYWICGTLQVLQCSASGEVTERSGLWLSVLTYMWKIAGTSV
jgi:hypothetical protein